MREVVTLCFGNYSAHVLAHFYNTQVSPSSITFRYLLLFILLLYFYFNLLID